MTPWARATTALRLTFADPAGCGGLALRSRPGPAREALLALIPGDVSRLHPALPLEALEGGIDVSASLSGTTLVRHRGLLQARNRTLLLTMAERCPPLIASRLCAALDQGQGHRLIALDEGVERDEHLPPALQDRLAFHVSLEGLGQRDIAPTDPIAKRPVSTKFLQAVECPEEALEELVQLAVTLGINSLRAPSLALRAARAHVALNRRNRLTSEDILVAAELVLAPRATRIPQETPEEPEAPAKTPPEATAERELTALPQEILLEAIRTALPADLLAKSGSNKGKNGFGSGAGAKRTGSRRGRPLPARDATPRGKAPRVDLMATLRAAVPWQTLRRAQGSNRPGPIIRPSDLRYRRYEELSDRLLVFVVDASGSAALARLAEAKGAVEILLSEAYARRDHVALIAFRGKGADLLLPPTRSLVQTKRRLAELPGGGGTPLAAGLQMGCETACGAFRKGLSPVLILLTDGRANIALDGKPDRKQAAEDAQRVAAEVAAQGVDSIVIDTGRRPEPALRQLALSLRGQYASLPRADARGLSDTVSAALEG
ncbi:MAG: magnesium chelatase subunit D [Sulfitobacter sp.]|nr:magnesium chelatase subunit D [Sulfitobacter sp.]